jgi:predicted phosphohydrolase
MEMNGRDSSSRWPVMHIAITADLHFGHNRLGDDAIHLLLEHLQNQAPDLLLLGGDIGTDDHFAECLQVFRALPCRKALVPGNHDLWVADNDQRGDSLAVYERHLSELCNLHEYHYLDHAPLVLTEANLAIVGSINWYDYSWSLERMKAEIPNWQWHIENKAFSRGRHNDGRFVRWKSDDVSFTRQVVATLERHLTQSLEQVEHALVLTHHPAFHGLGFPRAAPAQGLDELLWEALSGNRGLETVLAKHAGRIPLILSGHTHRNAEAQLGPARGINIGGDYHFKRMLIVDWPAGTIDTFVFGDPNRRR